MKRLIAALLAAALVVETGPVQAAELLKNLKFTGQIDLQATNGNNVTDFVTRGNASSDNNDRLGDAQTRIMLQMDWDLLDDTHAVLTLRKNDRSYGTNGGNEVPGAASTNSQPLFPAGGTDAAGNIYLDQAYFKIDKIAGQVDAAFGRQFYGESGDLVIYYGPSDKAWYGLPVTALDAARLDWNSEWMGVTGVVGKITGSPVGTTGAGDADLRGLNVAFKGNEYLKGTIYGWNRLTYRTGAAGTPPNDLLVAGGKNDNLYVLGAKAKLTLGPWWLRGEYAQNLGENRTGGSPTDAPAANYMGYAILGNTGLKLESESGHAFTVWGENLLASGRSNSREAHQDGFVAINGDYRPGTYYGRFSVPNSNLSVLTGDPTLGAAADLRNLPGGFASVTNRWIFGGGMRYTPGFANRATLAASWWEYRMQRFNRVPNGVAPYKGNRHIGAEIDVDLTWLHSDNVAFAAGWANFQPGGLLRELRNTTNDHRINPAVVSYFDVRVKF